MIVYYADNPAQIDVYMPWYVLLDSIRRENMHPKSQHPRFLELLVESDQEILSFSLSDLRQRTQKSTNFQEDGLWSTQLVEYIEGTDPSELINLHWIAERHYASKLRDPSLIEYFEHYYLIGYLRIISVMMLYHTNMGYDSDDLFFVVGFLNATYGENDKEVSILEIGTGDGEFLSELAVLGYRNLEGIDMTASAARLAKTAVADTIGEEAIHWMSFDEFQEHFPEKRFDVVINANLIEHIPDHKMDEFLAGIHHHLKPGGYMVVITPSRLSGPHDITRSFLQGGSASQGFHLREFDLNELEELLTAASFGRFMTVRSLPSLNDFWDSVPTEGNFHYKRDFEQFLLSIEWKLRKPIIDGMYYKGLICQKLPE